MGKGQVFAPVEWVKKKFAKLNRNFGGDDNTALVKANTQVLVTNTDGNAYVPITASDFKIVGGSMSDLYESLKWKSYKLDKQFTTSEQTATIGTEAFPKAREYLVYVIVGGAGELNRTLHIINGMGHVGCYMARGEQTATPYVRIAGSTVYFGCYSINNLGVTLDRIYYR
jgi:hypothetical protein